MNGQDRGRPALPGPPCSIELSAATQPSASFGSMSQAWHGVGNGLAMASDAMACSDHGLPFGCPCEGAMSVILHGTGAAFSPIEESLLLRGKCRTCSMAARPSKPAIAIASPSPSLVRPVPSPALAVDAVVLVGNACFLSREGLLAIAGSGQAEAATNPLWISQGPSRRCGG
jgi:hypothetical protein